MGRPAADASVAGGITVPLSANGNETKTKRARLRRPPGAMTPDRPLEELQLSVRARNALRRLGCETVDDVFHLDFNGSLRQLGSKTRSEVLNQLGAFGFRPVLAAKPLMAEMSRIARSLDRAQSRINSAFESVIREIRGLQDRIEKLSE